MTDSTEPRAARELKNCPACDCHTPGTRWTEGKHIAGFCPACGCQGPVARTLEKAETYWNALPRPTTDTVERAAVLDLLETEAEFWRMHDDPQRRDALLNMRRHIRALPSAGGGEDKLREIAASALRLKSAWSLAENPSDSEKYAEALGDLMLRVCKLSPTLRAALQQEPTK